MTFGRFYLITLPFSSKLCNDNLIKKKKRKGREGKETTQTIHSNRRYCFCYLIFVPRFKTIRQLIIHLLPLIFQLCVSIKALPFANTECKRLFLLRYYFVKKNFPYLYVNNTCFVSNDKLAVNIIFSFFSSSNFKILKTTTSFHHLSLSF